MSYLAILDKSQPEISDPTYGYQADCEATVSNGPWNPVCHHCKFRHATNTGQQIERHKDDTDDRQSFEILVLVDVNETDCSIHLKVDLVEKKCSVADQ